MKESLCQLSFGASSDLLVLQYLMKVIEIGSIMYSTVHICLNIVYHLSSIHPSIVYCSFLHCLLLSANYLSSLTVLSFISVSIVYCPFFRHLLSLCLSTVISEFFIDHLSSQNADVNVILIALENIKTSRFLIELYE